MKQQKNVSVAESWEDKGAGACLGVACEACCVGVLRGCR